MQAPRWIRGAVALVVVSLVALALNAGCCGKVLRDELKIAEGTSAAFVKQMDAGGTTREQEQSFIRTSHTTLQKARRAAGD